MSVFKVRMSDHAQPQRLNPLIDPSIFNLSYTGKRPIFHLAFHRNDTQYLKFSGEKFSGSKSFCYLIQFTMEVGWWWHNMILFFEQTLFGLVSLI